MSQRLLAKLPELFPGYDEREAKEMIVWLAQLPVGQSSRTFVRAVRADKLGCVVAQSQLSHSHSLLLLHCMRVFDSDASTSTRG